jgi:hypothetical protein
VLESARTFGLGLENAAWASNAPRTLTLAVSAVPHFRSVTSRAAPGVRALTAARALCATSFTRLGL